MLSSHTTCTHPFYNHEKPLGLPVASQRFVVRTEVYRDHVIDLVQRCLVGTTVYRDHVTDLTLKDETRRQFSLGFTLLLVKQVRKSS